MKELQEAKALVSAMEDGRQTRLPVWRLIQRHILPQRGLFGGETAQSAKESASRRLSSAGTWAIRRTAAGLTSSITPQDLRWFSLTPADRNILELPNVRTWLDDIETKMRTALTNSGITQFPLGTPEEGDKLWGLARLGMPEVSSTSKSTVPADRRVWLKVCSRLVMERMRANNSPMAKGFVK